MLAGRAASAAVWRAAAAVIDRQRVRRAAMWQETGRMLAEPEIVQVARADRAASGIGRAELVERVALVGRVALRIGRAEPAALADPAVWEIGQAAPVDRVGSVELAARAALRIGQAGPVALVVSAALQIGRAASVGPVASVGRVASGIDRADLAVLVASAALVVSAALEIDLVLGRPSVPVLEPDSRTGVIDSTIVSTTVVTDSRTGAIVSRTAGIGSTIDRIFGRTFTTTGITATGTGIGVTARAGLTIRGPRGASRQRLGV